MIVSAASNAFSANSTTKPMINGVATNGMPAPTTAANGTSSHAPTANASDHAFNAREHAKQLLPLGTSLAGFTVTHREKIAELDADAYVLHHEASGARLLYLACEDENKAFSIGFKTPPTDDTGVFHILEHSVLCGSAKFPVKEPFVDLIKSSMQTFLNAMTYPDKTIYPVATTNEQDLLNLMDVYMDAVLNPAIYTKRSIFEQEGWHYELDVPEGAAPREGALRYNGVVFNEMKGALSDPMDVLDNAINQALFPDNAYACESGGNPRAIPQLTYEQFLNTHARHYNLANSYLTLYGDLDIERVLTFLDERYLCQTAREKDASARAAALGLAEGSTVGAPNPIEMETTPENASVGLGYVIGDAQDRKRIISADILFDALLGSNEAPVKKAILAAGLGGNVMSYTSTHCLQPYEFIVLQNAQPEVARRLRETVENTCRELIEHGIPRDRLEAVISSNEYDLRQRDFGTADGVALGCDALSTWLYEDTDEAATRALKYGDIYADLRRELDGPYFENLLRELVLESDHYALVELKPVGPNAETEPIEVTEDQKSAADRAPSDAEDAPAPANLDVNTADPGEAVELAAARATMSDADLQTILDNVAALRAAQEADDTPEAKATLPRLHVSDIGPARPEPACTLDTDTPLPCLKHDIPTHRLAYALTYFDLSHLSYAELPYVTVLAKLMQQLPTTRHSAAELDSYIGSNLGFLSFRAEVYMPEQDWRLARPMLLVSAGALSEKIDALATIPHEVWAETIIEDTDRMRDVLTQLRIGQEQSFLMAGHQAALVRAMSYVSPASVVVQQLSGVDFYRFVRDLLDNFDERKDELCAKLCELQQRIFTSTGTLASFTGSNEDYARYWSAAGTLGLTPRTAPSKELYVPMPEDKHEAFIIPSDVCYAARAIDPRRLGITMDGAWGVASTALSYDYLWNEIRVKGGAYGCGFVAGLARRLGFYTYRDPAIDPSQERIARAGTWLSAFEPERDTFEGFIVSCVSDHDAPIKPYALARRQDMMYLSDWPAGRLERLRETMLATTPEQLRALGNEVTRIAQEAPLCVFGGRELIEASALGLTPVDLLA